MGRANGIYTLRSDHLKSLFVRFSYVILSCWWNSVAAHGFRRQTLGVVVSAFWQPLQVKPTIISRSAGRSVGWKKYAYLSSIVPTSYSTATRAGSVSSHTLPVALPPFLFWKAYTSGATSRKISVLLSAERTRSIADTTSMSQESVVVSQLLDCIDALSVNVDDKESWVRGACEILERTSSSSFMDSPTDVPHSSRRLCELALETSSQLCQIGESESDRKQKKTWTDLQRFSERLLLPLPTKSMEPPAAGLANTDRSNALAISLVFGCLAFLPVNSSGAKGAASALALACTKKEKEAASASTSTISSENENAKPPTSTFSSVACEMLQVYLCYAIQHRSSTAFNWSTITQFARSFQTTDIGHPRLVSLVAQVIRHELKRVQDLGNAYDAWEERKHIVSSILALAGQIRPWSSSDRGEVAAQEGDDCSELLLLTPLDLIKEAIPLDYWHAAELLCKNAGDVASSTEMQEAVEYLVDFALEERTYRRADHLATNLYDLGGRSRFVVARFQHACDTISQVVYSRQIPIIERQVSRVDKAIEKVKQDPSSAEKTITLDDIGDPSQEIRSFALMRLEEAGELDSAHRLATLWNMDYVYDEEAIFAMAAARREKFLQFDNVLSDDIPGLISDPQILRESFAKFWKQGPYPRGPFGLDAEWEEGIQGVDLLQLSHPKQAILVDIPALVSSEDGMRALRETVGALLDSLDSVVIGFACGQDLNRLKKSRGKHAHSWLMGTQAVLDLQPIVVKKEPKLAAISSSVGLSRVCQHYFGKPLDKSEQCSFWGARPLSERQRSYAALDAWVCASVYELL